MRAFLATVALAAALALPAAAQAAKCEPPGVSGVNQYFESIPGVSCNVSSTGSGSHHSRPAHHRSGAGGSSQSGGSGGQTGGSLPAGTQQQLAAQGSTGAAVAQLVASSGTAPTTSHHKRGGSGSTGSATAPASGPGRGLIGGIVHPLLTGSSQGGVGVLLPVFLVATLALVLAAVVLRRSRSRKPPASPA